ncbi:hypothetical protein ACWD4G_39080 [Streptomyces sp. NPDC002643]
MDQHGGEMEKGREEGPREEGTGAAPEAGATAAASGVAASGGSGPRQYQKDRIAEHVIGHVIGGAIIGVMAWFWTQTPVGFVMTVIWGAGVYWWNKSPLVQGWPRRRRIRLGIAITATYWLFAFLVM